VFTQYSHFVLFDWKANCVFKGINGKLPEYISADNLLSSAGDYNKSDAILS